MMKLILEARNRQRKIESASADPRRRIIRSPALGDGPLDAHDILGPTGAVIIIPRAAADEEFALHKLNGAAGKPVNLRGSIWQAPLCQGGVAQAVNPAESRVI